MKTERSAPSLLRSPRARGFTLLETTIALGVLAMSVTMIAWIASSFLGGKQVLQASAVNTRLQIDELAASLRSNFASVSRAFSFDGELRWTSGGTYDGSSLELSKPIYEVVDGDDFLLAAGLQVAPHPSGGQATTVIALVEEGPPVVVQVRSTTSDGGTRVVILTTTGLILPQEIRFGVAAVNDNSRWPSIFGGAQVADDGHVVLTLPNPLAMRSAWVPSIKPGCELHFPNHAVR